MEPPVKNDNESVHDEKVKMLKATSPQDEGNLCRGQFRGNRSEKAVAPDSKVETFAGLRPEVNSWRWQGVPFYPGWKCLPVICIEVLIRFRHPPLLYPFSTSNHMRLRKRTDVAIATGMMVIAPGQETEVN